MKRRTFLNLDALEGRALLSGLSYSLTTNQSTYQPGQPVEMSFTETNTSNHVIDATDGPSIDGFDVGQNGKVIWRSNAGPNPMYLRLVPLAPGQSFTLTATWNGVPTGGTSPVTGTFSIWNQRDPTLTTTVAITSSPTSPSAPASSPDGSPIIVSNPDPLPAPTAPSSSSSGNPIGSPTPVSGDGGSSTPGSDSGSVAGSSSGPTPIVVSVATNHPTYHKGQHVRMTVTVQNTGSSAVSLSKGSSGGLTLFEGSTPIWHRASIAGKAGSRRVAPGHSVKLSAVWNGTVHNAGMALAAGTYTLSASADGASGSTTFQVA